MFLCHLDAEPDATDAMISAPHPEKNDTIRNNLLNNQQFKNKKTIWSAEISNESHIMKLDEHGNFVVCLVCNGFGSGKVKKN